MGMKLHDIFKYYINYETLVALSSDTLQHHKKYQINRKELTDIKAIHKTFDLLKKDTIIAYVHTKLSQEDKEEFDEFILDVCLDDMMSDFIVEFLAEKVKDINIFKNEIQYFQKAKNLKIICPFFDNRPLYIMDCELSHELKVHHMSIVSSTLLELLSKGLCIDYADVQSDYEEELTRFHAFISSIDYQLDMKQIIYTCNEELNNIFNVSVAKAFSSYAAIVNDYMEKSNMGMIGDFIAIDHILEKGGNSPALLSSYLEQPQSSHDLKEFEKQYYFGSYESSFPVNETQFKIINALHEQAFLSVEGPPGTGKSSMLKEVIANNFVDRTRHLIQVFDEAWDKSAGIYQVPFAEHVINSTLVTSKNGEAVNNIDLDINQEVPYFHEIADKMMITKDNKTALANYQGMLCAKLGNKQNTNHFFAFFETTFLPYIKEHDVDEITSIIEEFKDIERALSSHYALLDKAEFFFGKKDYQREYISKSKEQYVNDKNENLQLIEDLHHQIEILTTDLVGAKKILDEERFKVEKLSFIMEETQKQISYNEEAILQCQDYEKLSTFKKLVNQHIRRFMKHHSIYDLQLEISQLRIKMHNDEDTLTRLQDSLVKADDRVSWILQCLKGLHHELTTYENTIIEIGECLANIDICGKIHAILDKDVTQYHTMYDVFSDQYLFDKRKRLFGLSLKINEGYIYHHKDEILFNLSKFWNGNFICSKYYNPTCIYEDYQLSAIKQLWNTFALCFPVITTTLDSFLKHNFQLIPNLFDLLLVDEAGQILPHYIVPGLYRSKKALFVGDVAQLEPIENIHNYHLMNLHPNEDPDIIDHLEISERSIQVHANERSFVKENNLPIMLKDHYRCEENIVAFSKTNVYSNLISHVENSFDKPFGNNLLMFDVRGMKDKTQHMNETEANAVIALIKKIRQFEDKHTNVTIGVITPFAKQKSLISNLLKIHNLDGINVGTVHTFQGKQNDYMIMSMVLDDLLLEHKLKSLYDFIGKKANLMNVALTRAKKQFIVVGNYECMNNAHNYMSKVLEVIKQKGNIFSMFMDPIETYTNAYDKDILEVLHACKQFDEKAIVGSYIEENFPHGLIETPQAHYELLMYALQNVEDYLYVCSPWIQSSVLNPDTIALIKQQIAKKIRIEMTIGYKQISKKEGSIVQSIAPYKKIDATEKLLKHLISSFKDNIHITPPLHTKFLIIDDKYMFIGSHNWLSNSGKTNTKELSTLVTDKNTIEYVKKKYLCLKDVRIERLAKIR